MAVCSTVHVENDDMRVRVKVHGLLVAAVDSADRLIELDLLDGMSIAGAIEVLQETSPLFDPGSCLAVGGGVKVSHGQVLGDGDEVHLYHAFSGG